MTWGAEGDERYTTPQVRSGVPQREVVRRHGAEVLAHHERLHALPIHPVVTTHLSSLLPTAASRSRSTARWLPSFLRSVLSPRPVSGQSGVRRLRPRRLMRRPRRAGGAFAQALLGLLLLALLIGSAAVRVGPRYQ
jgi:hypothetical protein